jgi:chromosome segregation ATPase
MDFDQRTVEWERFLQLKSDLVSSFSLQHACRVCHCLELLKLSVCPESCQADSADERHDILQRLVDGVLDEDLFVLLKDELLKHDHSLQASVSTARKLGAFEAELARIKSELESSELPGQIGHLKAVAGNSENLQPTLPVELTSRLSGLEARIRSYEESLEALHTENSSLREQLRVMLGNEQRRGGAGLRTEVTELREEVMTLKSAVDTVSRQVNDNAAQLLQMKKERTELREEEIDGLMQKVSRQKAVLLEEVRRLNETTERKLDLMQSQHENTTQRLRETGDSLEKLTKEQSDLKIWQREVKNLSSHARNLQQAADSVFSSQQQFRDFQQVISQSLEELRREVEFLKAGRAQEGRQESLMRSNEEYQAGIIELRKQSKQVVKKLEQIGDSSELSHPGRFEFNSELGVPCWSCCKTSRESKGCVKRGV